MSLFDPNAFLDATIDTPTVRRPPLPIENPASPDGTYMAVCGEPKARTWESKKDPGKSGVAMDMPLTIDVPAQLQESMQLPPQVLLTDGIMLDLTPQGTIDTAPGKNRKLRVYREAADMNKPGDVFSFRKFSGRVFKVKITHEVYEGDILDKIGTVLKP